MSRSYNKKRRRYPKLKADRGIMDAVLQRHSYGRTEKILRRNRKTWTRLSNKIRRRLDKVAIEEI